MQLLQICSVLLCATCLLFFNDWSHIIRYVTGIVLLSNHDCNCGYLFADFGQYKLEAKTKTNSGVEFTTNGSSTHESGAFAGSLETKYKWSEHGK